MGQQRFAWSDNETEQKISNHKEELKEQFGDNWKKQVWKIGVNEAIDRLPSLEQRLQKVRDQQEKLEREEQKIMAKKRKVNIKSKENKLEKRISELEDELKKWRDKKVVNRSQAEKQVVNEFQDRSQKWKEMDKDEILSHDRAQRTVEAKLEDSVSEEKRRSKISELESKLQEKKEELEQLEVQTYAP